MHLDRRTFLATLALLPGCHAHQDTSTKPKDAAGKPTVALIMKSLANEFFKTMEDGARKHQAEHSADYELIANGIKDESDVSRQVDLVKQMIAQGVSAIVIAPADSKGLVKVCKEAQDAGIIVVNIDNKLDADALKLRSATIPFVGPDNRKGAKMVGEHLAKQLKAGDQVAIIEGMPGAFNGIQRRLGFEDAVNAAGLKIVSSQSGKWETDEATKIVGRLLPEHPDLKGILCANDSMALGAVAALRAANKSEQVLVVGFDNISGVQQRIKDGKMLATADQHAGQVAVEGIKYALEILRTKNPPADKETPVDLVTAASLK